MKMLLFIAVMIAALLVDMAQTRTLASEVATTGVTVTSGAPVAAVIDPVGAGYKQISASSVFAYGGYGVLNLFNLDVSLTTVGTVLPDEHEWAVAGLVTNAYVAFDLGRAYTASSLYYAQRVGNGNLSIDKMNGAAIWASQTSAFNPNSPPLTPADAVVALTNLTPRAWTEYGFGEILVGRYFLVQFIQTSGAGYAPGGSEMRLGGVLLPSGSADVIDPCGASYQQIASSSVFAFGSYGATNLFNQDVSLTTVGTVLPDANEWAVAGLVTNAFIAFDLGRAYTASSLYYAQRIGTPPGDMMNVAAIWASQASAFNPNSPPSTPADAVVVLTNLTPRAWTEYGFGRNVVGRYFLVQFIQTSGAGYAPGGNEMRLGGFLSPSSALRCSVSAPAISVAWPAPSPWILQQADTVTGTWATATGVTNGVPGEVTASNRFYRLRLSPYWANAQAVNNYVRKYLATPYHSYRVQPGSSSSYSWYNASQMYADSAMVAMGDGSYAASMNGTFQWMRLVWDVGSPTGGYFAGASLDGSGAGYLGLKYADDNSFFGNVFLDCYELTSGYDKASYLDAAQSAANYLMNGGLWDATFGGGFWWSNAKEIKPTQSNGLVIQLFLRLYQITGQAYYRDWANSVRDWLDVKLYNPTTGLYSWLIQTNGTPDGVRNYAEFTYDNAIMIEADLLYYQVTSNAQYLARAQALASNLNTRLWNDAYGVYAFNTTDNRVNPCWCGWASQSLIKLYEVDGKTNWLNYAQRNIDYMNRYLATGNGGFYWFCNMDGSNVSSNDIEAVDQSWMQKLQAMMSRYR